VLLLVQVEGSDVRERQHFNVMNYGVDQTSADDRCPVNVDHQLLMLRKELDAARAQIKKIVRCIHCGIM